MNLLLVDDEYYSIENLKTKLDWNAMGFEQVFCAYSMEQARQVFDEHIIDVLLCDIEMPKGTGLDLLEWIRTQRYQTVCVFLTCHAKFDYASRAIKLESSDYLLKPVEAGELREAVERAIEKRRQDEAGRLNELHAEYWMKSGVQRAERFWKRVTDGRVPMNAAELGRELDGLHLPAALLAQRYVPVLLECKKTDSVLEWEQNLYDYAIKNIANELLFHGQEDAAIVHIGAWQYFVPLPLAGGRGEAVESCKHALKALASALPGVFCFYVAEACGIEQVFTVCEGLCVAAKEDIAKYNKVRDLTISTTVETPLPVPPLGRWNDLLLSRKTEEVRSEAVQYLQKIGGSTHTTRRDLLAFYHDFSQILYSLLDRRGAPAHKLFADAADTQIAEQACDSVQAMEAWITHILTAYVQGLAATGETGSVIEEVQRYVRDHLAEDLNRNCLAQAVFLSPDYLSHLFREKAGMSLTEYITRERIRKAKELLGDNSLSVRDIALASGFQNISYFSKQFKKATGKTPQEFRRA